MQTRKDLLQAHRLMTQRASQALMLGEPDTPELPLRRLNIAAFCGVMVAVLVMAVYGIWGLLAEDRAKVDQAGTLIIEKETGTRYVWCEFGGPKLCPVLNYSSAKLLAGTSQKLVSRNSLTKYDRGPLLGIPGAPDTLPDPGNLVTMPWSVCVRAVDTRLGRVSMVSLIAERSVGGRPVPDDQAILVQADGQSWLIWRDKRMRVPSGEVSGLSATVSPAQIAGKWLNALPEGSAFKAPDIPGRGQVVAGPQGQAPVGQLYTAPTVSGMAWYVLMRDGGLARVSEIEGQLMKLDPTAQGSASPKNLDPATLGSARKHQGPISSPDLQAKMPTIVPYTDMSALCATYTDATGNEGAHLTIGGQLPTPPKDATGGSNSVDQLLFPPGRAALVGVLPSQGKRNAVSTFYLVAEGRRFALQSIEVAQKLGYNPINDAIPVPASVVELIPNGPILDPGAAMNPVVGDHGTGTQPPG